MLHEPLTRIIKKGEKMQENNNINKSEPKKLMTRDEAARYLRIGKTCLSKLIHDRDFPALVRIGNGRGRVFINREVLDKWIDERTGK